MKTEFIAQTDSRYTHIERQPEVYQPDIDIKSILEDQYITDKIDDRGRDAEPYEKGGLAQKEESGQTEYKEQYYRIDR